MRLLNGLMFLGIAALTFAGCGGAGEGSQGLGNQTGPVVLYVNKNGVNRTYPFTTTTNYTQNPNSGYFVYPPAISFGSDLGPPPRIEWSGRSLGYTKGYVLPTSGILETFSITSDEIWYSIQNGNFDLSKSPPTLDPSNLVITIFLDAPESKIFGGQANDTTSLFFNTTEIDLQGGVDTLDFSQNYSLYKFQKVAGQPTSVIVERRDSPIKILIKNVEQFRFQDGTKTLAQILASIP